MIEVLHKTVYNGTHEISIAGSKSESNRLLILQKLVPDITIKNLSTSDDTKVLEKALSINQGTIDIHHAGTAMRFLTAYLAFNTINDVKLTGSQRMQERPIEILVNALRDLGANIKYEKKEGYPPLIIKSSEILKNKVELKANVSSQYISALMLSASNLKDGLHIKFDSEVTSLPYILMTVNLMKKIGIDIKFSQDEIRVLPKTKINPIHINVESDWSSASYFYSLVALSKDLKLKLNNFYKDSLQGDSKLSDLYDKLGVKTTFLNGSILLEKEKNIEVSEYIEDLNHTPDLAQTIAVTCLGLKINCHLKGLHTLKIKETDRLVAMKTELEKFGAKVDIDDKSLKMVSPNIIKSKQIVETYNDHRMAMAFAPLCSKVDLTIKDAEVVSKSYPNFWNDFYGLNYN